MKLLINGCYGGFSLSPAAIKRFAELKGRPCYFFRQEGFQGAYIAVPDPIEANGVSSMRLSAFDIPNPNEVLSKPDAAAWSAMTMDEKRDHNELYSKHRIESRPEDRADADLIRVVEELGSEAASGVCARLKIIEIPDGIEWELDEYDGIESVEEKHQSWPKVGMVACLREALSSFVMKPMGPFFTNRFKCSVCQAESKENQSPSATVHASDCILRWPWSGESTGVEERIENKIAAATAHHQK